MSSFTVVQFAQAVGPWGTPGTAQVSLPNPVAFGNIIVAFFGAYRDTYTPWAYPSAVTDNRGNEYDLFSQSVGQADNVDACAFLWASRDVTGGLVTVTFSGWTPGGGSGIGVGPSIIVAEIEPPLVYQIWGMGLTIGDLGSGQYLYLQSQQNNSYSDADSQVVFRALANNGGAGGAGASDTGECSLLMSPQGYNYARCASNVVGLAIVNEFNDVFLIGGNYNPGNPVTPFFAVSASPSVPCGLIVATFEPTGGASSTPGCSGCLAYGDFPYSAGPLTGGCGPTPNGQVGTSYTDTLTASGGVGPYTFAVTAGSLPTSLTLDGSTGIISGTPTVAGTFDFTITVTDSASNTYSYPCEIVIIAENLPVPSCADPPGGIVGTPYTHQFTATSGTPPYAFSISVGSLPPGLTMNGAGLVTGIPTTAGTYDFTLEVTDAEAHSSTVPCAISIVTPPPSGATFFLTHVAIGLKQARMPVRGSAS